MSPPTLVVPLGGERVGMRVQGDRELFRRLHDLYDGGSRDPSAARIVVRWKGEFGDVRRGSRPVAWSTNRRSLLEWAEWAATREALSLARSRGLILHAAWVAGPQGSVLLAGAHGSGKTTLAVSLFLRHGWRVVSDDLVLLGPGGPRPIERPVRIKRGTARLVPELPAGLSPLSRFGGGAGAPPPTAIVLLGRVRPGRARCVRIPQGAAVARLARYAQNLGDRPAESLGRLAALTARATAHELEGGSLQERRAKVLRLVRSGESR